LERNNSLLVILCLSLHPVAINGGMLSRVESINQLLIITSIYLLVKWKEHLSFIKLLTVSMLSIISFIIHPLAGLVSSGTVFSALAVLSISNKRFNFIPFVTISSLGIIFALIILNSPFVTAFADDVGTFSISMTERIAVVSQYFVKNLFFRFGNNFIFYFSFVFIFITVFYTAYVIYTTNRHYFEIYFILIFYLFVVTGVIFVSMRTSRFYFFYILFALLPLLVISAKILLGEKYYFAVIPVVIFFIINNILWIDIIKDADYRSFERELQSVVPDNSNIMASIVYSYFYKNTNVKFYALEDNYNSSVIDNLSVDEYIKKYSIQYLIVTERDFQTRKGLLAFTEKNCNEILFLKTKFFHFSGIVKQMPFRLPVLVSYIKYTKGLPESMVFVYKINRNSLAAGF